MMFPDKHVLSAPSRPSVVATVFARTAVLNVNFAAFAFMAKCLGIAKNAWWLGIRAYALMENDSPDVPNVVAAKFVLIWFEGSLVRSAIHIQAFAVTTRKGIRAFCAI